jgi:hypothetical protein
MDGWHGRLGEDAAARLQGPDPRHDARVSCATANRPRLAPRQLTRTAALNPTRARGSTAAKRAHLPYQT